MARSSLASAGIWGAVYDRLQERRSFATPGDLARYLNPRIIDTPALELIDEKLVHLVRSHDGRLIISVPPQEGKSERGAFAFPLWALMRDPSLRIAIASYSHDVAARWGMGCVPVAGGAGCREDVVDRFLELAGALQRLGKCRAVEQRRQRRRDASAAVAEGRGHGLDELGRRLVGEEACRRPAPWPRR